MTDFMFLPSVFGLVGFGWLLGRHHDAILAWLDHFLDDDQLPPASMLHHPCYRGRRHLRVVRPHFDFERDSGDVS